MTSLLLTHIFVEWSENKNISIDFLEYEIEKLPIHKLKQPIEIKYKRIGPFLGQLETRSIPVDRQWTELQNTSESEIVD